MLLIENLSNVCLKKKLFYKFTKLFEIQNIIKRQIYCFRLFKK